MKTWLKILLITVGIAVPAFILGPIIWPPDIDGAKPVGLQMLLAVVLAALEALAFGLGGAFIAYGLPLVRQVAGGSVPGTWATFIATAWLLLSWWPHDSMHRHNGMDLGGLLMIEYLFHVSMMVAGAVLAYTLVRSLQAASISLAETAEQAPAQIMSHVPTKVSTSD